MTRTKLQGEKRTRNTRSRQAGRDEGNVLKGRDEAEASSGSELGNRAADKAVLGGGPENTATPTGEQSAELIDNASPGNHTGALAAEYAVGSSPMKEDTWLAFEEADNDGLGSDTAIAATEYAVDSSQGIGTAPAPLLELEHPAEDRSPIDDTARLAMDYFVDGDPMEDVEPVAFGSAELTAALAKEYSVGATQDDVPPGSSDGEMGLVHKGLPEGDVTLVSVRKRCRDALLECYLQEKLAVQGLLDCRRRLTEYITLLQAELDSQPHIVASSEPL
ncbi:hypothetical protein CC1G_10450 [Coprinopsis cinerea okayama7|uniref:Uncharacterized protein n=1 Tax=Coprinopsis cinerea (strain Okayama-7 / 130 / ATCC MYA-4618 / FGSC 9003) TaxID=240176 RepID=A8PDT7_COPC7|nr:hypothetical protein CC1G_10450 [Coprinopsis cinerea okayama7\|eukprot:XP_001840664.2 hypothetical protein CC1G_10450 [Coprinopsis cinerea okayama7\